MRVFLAILCVIPSAWVNINAQMATGAGLEILIGIGFLALMAPIFTLAAASSIERRHPFSTLLWSALAVIFIVVNTAIALSGISGVRDAAMDRRIEQQRQAGDRRLIADHITDLRKKIGSASAAMVKAEMDALPRGWKREQARVRWETAREAERLQVKVDGWVTSVEPEPSSVDPGISNIIALVVAIFDKKLDERFLAALFSGMFALLLELGADLGPIAIATLMRRSPSPRFPQPASHPANLDVKSRFSQVRPLLTFTSNKPANVDFKPGNVDSWQDVLFQVTQDSWTASRRVYDAYINWCRKRGREPISVTMFGREMGKRYQREKRGGIWCYNVELRPDDGIRAIT